MEKFSIDIETYYKPDTGNQGDVFNMSSAEKRLRTVGKSATLSTILAWTLKFVTVGWLSAPHNHHEESKIHTVIWSENADSVMQTVECGSLCSGSEY